MTPSSPDRPAVWFDHFVVAIKDLDVGTTSFELLTGVRPVPGGEHPTLGTHNTLVSLGERQYFEILAPRPGASLDPMVRGVDQCDVLTPLLWALATDDIRGVHDRVIAAGFGANDVVSGSRLTKDNDTLRWKMFTLRNGRVTNAPFFIEWDEATAHPSLTTPTGCSLESFTVVTPDRDEVSRLLSDIGFTVPVEAGPKQMMIALTTPRGTIQIGG